MVLGHARRRGSGHRPSIRGRRPAGDHRPDHRGGALMASLALAFDILARDKGASRTFDKVGDSAKRAGKSGTTFGSMFKKGLAVAGGALAAVGLAKGIGELGRFLGESIGEAREAQKV